MCKKKKEETFAQADSLLHAEGYTVGIGPKTGLNFSSSNLALVVVGTYSVFCNTVPTLTY